MKTYNEREKKLNDDTRRKLLESLATSDYGQAIREELVDRINDISSIKNVSPTLIDGETPKLAIEITGRGVAALYLEELYKLLTPKKEKVGFVLKSHK